MEEVTVGGATAFMYKALVAIKDLEETILTLLLWKGIPNKSTMASLGPVGKTIGNGVCTPLDPGDGRSGNGGIGNTHQIHQKQGTTDYEI